MTAKKDACGTFPCSAAPISASEVQSSFGPEILHEQQRKKAALLTDCRAFLNALNEKIVSPKPVFSFVNAPNVKAARMPA
ncbi:MAG: hypothetical protein ACLVKK_11205 [Ruthenibacterium sp.]